MKTNRPLLAALAALTVSGSAAAQTFHGPLPYLSRADSPFTDCVHFEDFEDHLFNQVGVSANQGFVTSTAFSTIIDSVDADDGVIDGSGLQGDSFFYGSGAAGITFTFDPVELGGFPTRAGIVWTDGAGTTSFQAFDTTGQSLGVIGPFAIANGSVNGETAEDRFYAVEFAGGISAIKVSNTSGGIEVDHLQYAVTVTAPVLATESVRLGSPANPDALRKSLATPPILGTLWTPYVDHTTFATGATVDFLFIDVGAPINVPLSIGTLLCTLPSTNQIFPVLAGDSFAVPIPSLCAFAGLSACSQAASYTPDAPVRLTNALDIVLGTH